MILIRECHDSQNQFTGKKEDMELRSKSSSKNLEKSSSDKHQFSYPRKYEKSKSEENFSKKYKLEPECELGSCSNSNILEAINLIIEDYKKSYLGRSLVLTGQTIILITCGDGNNFLVQSLKLKLK